MVRDLIERASQEKMIIKVIVPECHGLKLVFQSILQEIDKIEKASYGLSDMTSVSRHVIVLQNGSHIEIALAAYAEHAMRGQKIDMVAIDQADECLNLVDRFLIDRHIPRVVLIAQSGRQQDHVFAGIAESFKADVFVSTSDTCSPIPA